MPFQPIDLPNLRAWYKADAGVTGSGTTVSAWADQSGNGMHLSLTNPLNYLALIGDAGNGMPGIKSQSNANGYGVFTVAGFPALTSGTIWLVMAMTALDKTINSGVSNGVLVNSNFAFGRHNFLAPDSIVVEGATSSVKVTAPITDDEIYVVRLRINATDFALSLNNDTEIVDGNGGTPASGALSFFGTGDKIIQEAIFFTDEKTGNDLAEVQYYLHEKYGIEWTGDLPDSEAGPVAVITFPSLSAKQVGTADFSPGATSTNTVTPITYTSSNLSVATIVSGQIHIVGPGTTNITASQAAGNGYAEATPVVRALTVTPNTSNMANVNDSIDGKVVSLSISTNTGTPAYKAVVCSSGDIGVNGTLTGGSEVVTRCGIKRSPGTAGWEVSGSGVANTDLSDEELSHNELAALFASQASFLVRVQDESTPANYYRQGQGTLSDYRETAAIDGVVGFDFTVSISGPLDLTA